MKTVLFLLGELDDDDLDWLIAVGDRQEIPTGTVLIREGEPASNLYILLEGSLSVMIAALQGKEIASLLSGDIVGEMSFVDTRLPSATVSAKQNSVVLSIPKDQLAAKLQIDDAFAARFYRALAISLSSRLRITVSQLKNLNLPTSIEVELPVSELSSDAKESVALAKTRLDWLLRRLQKGEEEEMKE